MKSVASLDILDAPRHGQFHLEKNNTLTETNIAPARKPFQNESSLPTIHFQVLV